MILMDSVCESRGDFGAFSRGAVIQTETWEIGTSYDHTANSMWKPKVVDQNSGL